MADEFVSGSTTTFYMRQMFDSYSDIVARAIQVFGDEKKASAWLSTRSNDFDGMSPIESLSKTGDGRQVLLNLGRIEHGVFF